MEEIYVDGSNHSLLDIDDSERSGNAEFVTLECAEFSVEPQGESESSGFENIESINEWIIIEGGIKEEVIDDGAHKEEDVLLIANDAEIPSKMTFNKTPQKGKKDSKRNIKKSTTQKKVLPHTSTNTIFRVLDTVKNTTAQNSTTVNSVTSDLNLPQSTVTGPTQISVTQLPIQHSGLSVQNTNTNYNTLPFGNLSQSYFNQVPNMVAPPMQMQNLAIQLPSGQIVPIQNNTVQSSTPQYTINNSVTPNSYYCIMPNSTPSFANNTFNIGPQNVSYQIVGTNNTVMNNMQQQFIQGAPPVYNNGFIQPFAQGGTQIPTYIMAKNTATQNVPKREIWPKGVKREILPKINPSDPATEYVKVNIKPFMPRNDVLNSTINRSTIIPSTTSTWINQPSSTVTSTSNMAFQVVQSPTGQMNLIQQPAMIPQLNIMPQTGSRISQFQSVPQFSIIPQQSSQMVPQMNSVFQLPGGEQNMFSIQPNPVVTPISNIPPNIVLPTIPNISSESPNPSVVSSSPNVFFQQTENPENSLPVAPPAAVSTSSFTPSTSSSVMDNSSGYKLISCTDPLTNSQYYKLVPIQEPISQLTNNSATTGFLESPPVNNNNGSLGISVPPPKIGISTNSSDRTGITFLPTSGVIGTKPCMAVMPSIIDNAANNTKKVGETEIINLDSSDDSALSSHMNDGNVENENSNKETLDIEDSNSSLDSVHHIDIDEFENSAEAEDILFYCTFCNQLFPTKILLDDHVKFAHRENNNGVVFICASCDKQFSNKSIFEEHVKSHFADESSLKCCVCEKQFLNKNLLERHSKVHSSRRQKIVYCDYCKKSFCSKLYLIRHIRHSHMNDLIINQQENNYQKNHRRSLICDDCGVKFNRKSSLANHVKIHLVEIFNCKLCKKFYRRKSLLLNHVKYFHKNQLDD